MGSASSEVVSLPRAARREGSVERGRAAGAAAGNGTRPHERIQLFLVSSNRLLREALARLLRNKEDIYVAGVTHDAPEALGQIEEKNCEVLLLDGAPPEVGGRPMIPQLLKRMPGVKVVLMGMEDSEAAFLRAVREGAAGFLLEDASAADVVAAVRAVAQGEAVCPPHLCWALFRYTARQASGLPSVRVRVQLGLTRRQQQLLPLIAQGCTNKEIASLLNLSEQTVKNHIHRMLLRVGAEDRLGVVELCRNQGHLV